MTQSSIGCVDLMVDRHVRSGRGRHTALIEICPEGQRRSMSYRDLQQHTVQIAHGLSCKQPDTILRIAIIGSATLETITWWLGAMRGGHLVFLVHPDLPAAQYPVLFSVFKPDIVLCDRTAKRYDGTLIPLVCGIDPEISLPETPLPEPQVASFDDARPALVLASSGSTGRPKLCVHSHRALWGFERYVSRPMWGLHAGDRVLASGGPFFSFGLQGIHPSLSVGATAILLPEWNKHEDFLNAIETEEASVFLAVPTLYHLLQSRTDAQSLQQRTRSLRIALSAGERLPDIVRRRWEIHTGVSLCDSIGTTETFLPYFSEAVGASGALRDVGCFDYEMRFTETTGESAETVFLAAIKGPYMMLGYLDDTGQLEYSKKRFVTHDLFVLRSAGWHFVSRRCERVKVSGLWVSPQELEEFLLQDDRVLKAAVVPLETDEGLQRLRAFVVLRHQDQTNSLVIASQLLASARVCIRPKALCPDAVQIVDDLSSTPTGKFKRSEFLTTVQSTQQDISSTSKEVLV